MTASYASRSLEVSSTPPDFQALLDPILPLVAGARDDCCNLRDTPVHVVDALRMAGLFRMFQPVRWGGHEADPRTFFALQNAIAEVCPSTAWVYGVLCVQALVVSLFDPRAQADVWSGEGDALVASSFAPTGKADVIGDGWRLSGRWTFASGSTHAQWALLGAKLADGSGQKLFLVPRHDFRIEDTWNTFGLRGTGSNDILVDGAFVPGHRALVPDPGVQTVARDDRPGPALYRLPWLYLFTASISNLAIGIGRAALVDYLGFNRARISPMRGKVVREDPAVGMAAARLQAEIDTVQAMYDRHIESLLTFADSDEVLPLRQGWLYRTQLTAALRGIAQRVDDLMLLQGARAVNLASPVTRAWLDLSAARAHIGNDPTGASTALGTALLDA